VKTSRLWSLVPPSTFLVAAAACSARLDHVFGAYAYDPVQDCLQGAAVVDVIAGPDPGMCPQVRCWQAPDGSIYVTSEACDAPLDYQDHTEDTSGPCVKALAAYAGSGNGLCAVPDGGSAPMPPDAADGGSLGPPDGSLDAEGG
jgi:hypothetical protein